VARPSLIPRRFRSDDPVLQRELLGGADISIFIGLPIAAILYYVLSRSIDTAHEREVAARTDVNLEQLAAAHSRD
jgi:hypothetical protein